MNEPRPEEVAGRSDEGVDVSQHCARSTTVCAYRLFSVDWLRRVITERLPITPDEIDGGHCVALSRPKGLADLLHGLIS